LICSSAGNSACQARLNASALMPRAASNPPISPTERLPSISRKIAPAIGGNGTGTRSASRPINIMLLA
jgi:hypothetical protein